MTNTQIKDYLKKYRIDSEEQLAKHIEELKRNTKPNNEIIFPLVDLLLNEKSVLLSFFRENSKERGETAYVRTVTPFFLDEMLGKCSTQCFCDGSCKKPQEKKLGGYIKPNVYVNSTRHKAREEGNFHKEIAGDLEGINRLPSIYNLYDNQNYYTSKALETLNNQSAERHNIMNSDENIKKHSIHLEGKDDVITNSSRGEKEMMKVFENTNTLRDFSEVVGVKESQTAYKETEGKLNYELDWEFIQQMAERMSQNKGKYEPYNWKRPMEIEKLKQSLFRHVVEVMKGNYSDDGREFGHFESIALNAMMINYQLKVK